MTTYCEECEFLHGESRGHPARWMCSKFPRGDGFGFVTKGAWDGQAPFMHCNGINGGSCPLFEEKREGQEE